jgi:hypothetical protein
MLLPQPCPDLTCLCPSSKPTHLNTALARRHSTSLPLPVSAALLYTTPLEPSMVCLLASSMAMGSSPQSRPSFLQARRDVKLKHDAHALFDVTGTCESSTALVSLMQGRGSSTMTSANHSRYDSGSMSYCLPAHANSSSVVAVTPVSNCWLHMLHMLLPIWPASAAPLTAAGTSGSGQRARSGPWHQEQWPRSPPGPWGGAGGGQAAAAAANSKSFMCVTYLFVVSTATSSKAAHVGQHCGTTFYHQLRLPGWWPLACCCECATSSAGCDTTHWMCPPPPAAAHQ